MKISHNDQLFQWVNGRLVSIFVFKQRQILGIIYAKELGFHHAYYAVVTIGTQQYNIVPFSSFRVGKAYVEEEIFRLLINRTKTA